MRWLLVACGSLLACEQVSSKYCADGRCEPDAAPALVPPSDGDAALAWWVARMGDAPNAAAASRLYAHDEAHCLAALPPAALRSPVQIVLAEHCTLSAHCDRGLNLLRWRFTTTTEAALQRNADWFCRFDEGEPKIQARRLCAQRELAALKWPRFGEVALALATAPDAAALVASGPCGGGMAFHRELLLTAMRAGESRCLAVVDLAKAAAALGLAYTADELASVPCGEARTLLRPA